MKEGWTTLISSATHHQNAVCELYFDNRFVLLISNDTGRCLVEFDRRSNAERYVVDNFVDALQACNARLVNYAAS